MCHRQMHQPTSKIPIFSMCRVRMGLLMLGALVTGLHQLRLMAAASPAAIAASLRTAARALVFYPVTVCIEGEALH